MNRNEVKNRIFAEFEKLLRSLAPFVKKPTSSHRTVIIGSKNETDDRLVKQLADWIIGTEVTMSHSQTHDQLQCRGVIHGVEYRDRKIEVSVTSESGPQIWEDTDVWIWPISMPPDSFLDQTSSSSSAEQRPLKSPEQMDQNELFQSINGWKYLSGTFRRRRRKENENWVNVYLTEMRMTPVELEKSSWTKFVKEHTALRLSHDIDELGDVFVEVCRRSEHDNSITLSVTGFASTDVDAPLFRHVTYYLNIDDGEDDELASQSTEHEVLDGYILDQNVEELCEKIGELTVADVCIKTWFDIRHNFVFIRLVVKPITRTLAHFKKLNGVHVTIHPTGGNCKSMVMAVVNKVMKHEIVLTLKGFPKKGPPMLFTKKDRFIIRYDQQFEERLLKHRDWPIEAVVDADIRLQNTYRRCEAGKNKTFASFSIRNRAISMIPIGKMVLLGKCWEVEGAVERKADFVFAVRVPDVKCPMSVTFEIKFTKSLVAGATEFALSQAFYYVDFDYSDVIEKDEIYGLSDAHCQSRSPNESARKSTPISAELSFFVFRYITTGRPVSHPSIPAAIEHQQAWTKPLVAIDPKRHKFLCYVSLASKLGSENRNPLVELRLGLDEQANRMSIRPLDIGSTLMLTEGNEGKTVKVWSEVQDTKKETAVLLVDHLRSDLDFLKSALNSNTLLPCYCER